MTESANGETKPSQDPPSILAFWKRLIEFEAAAVAIFAILSAPIFIVGLVAAVLLNNSLLLTYLLAGYVGWVAAYMASTYEVATTPSSPASSLRESEIQYLAAFLIYINAILMIDLGLSALVHYTTNQTVIVLVVATIYPFVDLLFAEKFTSPGKLILSSLLEILHRLGYLREIDADILTKGVRP